MNILVIGKNGQISRCLSEALAHHSLYITSRDDLDLCNEASIIRTIRLVKPAVIINAAAYTNVEQSEADDSIAIQVNGHSLSTIGKEARNLDALVLHYSTDYVFDGTHSEPYKERDVINPINKYGASKALGEYLLNQATPKHLILRTSWVFGSNGTNFVKTILQLADKKSALEIVSDQVGSPTSAVDLPRKTKQIIDIYENEPENMIYGTFHLTPKHYISWYGFALEIIEKRRAYNSPGHNSFVEIVPIPSSMYKTAAKRPLNSRLDSSKIKQCYGLEIPHWQPRLSDVVNSILRTPDA